MQKDMLARYLKAKRINPSSEEESKLQKKRGEIVD